MSYPFKSLKRNVLILAEGQVSLLNPEGFQKVTVSLQLSLVGCDECRCVSVRGSSSPLKDGIHEEQQVSIKSNSQKHPECEVQPYGTSPSQRGNAHDSTVYLFILVS